MSGFVLLIFTVSTITITTNKVQHIKRFNLEFHNVRKIKRHMSTTINAVKNNDSLTRTRKYGALKWFNTHTD